MTKKFYSNGKLLLTGEYGVLDGALSLAIPTKYGQSLTVSTTNDYKIHWESLDEKNRIWFEANFELNSFKLLSATDEKTAKVLLKMLLEAKKINSNFLLNTSGYSITTKLDFPRDWGLGSSSTLINNIAQWAVIDSFKLLWNSFTGSGYDIACASHNKPIVYQLIEEKPCIKEIDFTLPFKDAIYFIHLNKKQDSREGIKTYRKANFDKNVFIAELSSITEQIITCTAIEEFAKLITEHEAIIANILEQVPVKQLLFADYDGAIKSLGAWGGDFIMAVGSKNTMDYFNKKGYSTILNYSDMVL
tara:strand:- start:177597 stop:178505 length:909 start_codon:yes stop_codon:yes gene_type:complete